MKEVTVGNQIWAGENLAVTQFQNGEGIPVVENFVEWAKQSEKGLPCCAMLNNKKTSARYGFFYNGFCLDSPHELCPKGWRVPAVEDVLKLTTQLNRPSTRDDVAYYNGTVAQGIKGTKTWKKSFFGEPGDNSTGLNFLAGGSLTARDGLFVFDDKGFTAVHWLKDEHIASPGHKYFPPHPDDWPKERKYSFAIGTGGDHSLSINSSWLTSGFFVRLIKEEV